MVVDIIKSSNLLEFKCYRGDEPTQDNFEVSTTVGKLLGCLIGQYTEGGSVTIVLNNIGVVRPPLPYSRYYLNGTQANSAKQVIDYIADFL